MKAILSALLISTISSIAIARDNGQWAQNDPAVSQWYGRQKMPDNPMSSCCGEGDAYYADGVEVVNGNVFAIITDERNDGPLFRPHIPVGTKIAIPPEKNKDTRLDPNPTGHTIIFVKWYDEGDYFGVLCYLPEGSI